MVLCICVLRLNIGQEVLHIFAVYMPHRTCRIADFREYLDLLETSIEMCSHDGNVLVIGDTNCHLGHEVSERGWGETTSNGKHLLSMATRKSLRIADIDPTCSGPTDSFFRGNTGCSYIDHCLVSAGLRTQCFILPDSPQNTSDHLAMYVVIRQILESTSDPGGKAVDSDTLNSGVGKPCWHKLGSDDINANYTLPLQHKLKNAARKLKHMTASLAPTDIDGLIQDVVSCMLATSTQNLPHSKFSAKLKPYWSPRLTELSKESRSAWRTWNACGRPRDSQHTARVNYKAAKRQFRRE